MEAPPSPGLNATQTLFPNKSIEPTYSPKGLENVKIPDALAGPCIFTKNTLVCRILPIIFHCSLAISVLIEIRQEAHPFINYYSFKNAILVGIGAHSLHRGFPFCRGDHKYLLESQNRHWWGPFLE